MTDGGNEPAEDAFTSEWKRSTWPAMKVARAHGHALALRSRVEVWFAAEPLGIVVRINDDRLGATWTLNVHAVPPVEEWSLLVGDCVHQLRSALDACIWDLLIATRSTPKNQRRIQFPIEHDAARWPDVVKDRLSGLPDDVTERVRSIQPFNREEAERPNDTLALLQHLNNTDKHQANITVSVTMVESSHQMSVEFETEEASERNLPPNATFGPQTFVNGATLAELQTLDPIVKINGQWGFVLHLTIATPTGDQPAIETLENLTRYIDQVLAVVYGPSKGESEIPLGDDGWIDYEPGRLDA